MDATFIAFPTTVIASGTRDESGTQASVHLPLRGQRWLEMPDGDLLQLPV